MCFSSNASFIAAGGLTVIGTLVVSRTNQARLKPLSLTPLIFAAQQAIEGIVWLTSNNIHQMEPHKNAIYAYVFASHALWPFWIPFILFYAEKNSVNKKILSYFLAAGTCLSLLALYMMFTYSVSAQIINHSIDYAIDAPSAYRTFFALFYSVPVILPFFISTLRYAWLLGIALTASLGISYWFYYMTAGSVWCFFAAILSALTYWSIKKEQA